MSDITMDEISIVVSGSSDKATDSFERLITALDNLEGSVSSAIDGLKNINGKINNTTKGIDKVKSIFQNTTKGITKFGAALGITGLSFSSVLNSAIEYTQAYSGFNKVLGTSEENLERATKFVKDLTEAWYLDEKQVMQATSRYYNMMSTMGMTEDAAFRMSKNLTMLSYDLQLLGTTGATITEVQNQIGSALRGEAEGLAKFGISLNQATLQTVLYEKGINRTVSSLTAAQKAELIYYQIMRQTYSKHGYYAEQLGKDVLNPTIAVQALKNQFINLARAIGSVFIPILSALAPYIMAITQLLTQLAKTIANFLGFELGDWGSELPEISGGFGDIADSASQAGKEIKGMLRDFDELHVVSFPDTSGGGAGIGAGGSLGLDASEFEYGAEWLNVTNEKLEKAKQLIYDIKDYLITIGLIIAGYKISSGILDFLKNFGILSEKTNVLKTAIGIGLTIGSVFLLYKGIEKIVNGEINAESIIQTALGMFGLTTGIMNIANGLGITLGLGKGIIISTIVSLTIAGYKLYTEGIKKEDLLLKALGALFLGIATGITIGILSGMPVLGVVVGLSLFLSLLSIDIGDPSKKMLKNHGKMWGSKIAESTVIGFDENVGEITSSISSYWRQIVTDSDEQLSKLEEVAEENYKKSKERALEQINELNINTGSSLTDMKNQADITLSDMTKTIDSSFLKSNLATSMNLREMKQTTTETFTKIEQNSEKKFKSVNEIISNATSDAKVSMEDSTKSMSDSMKKATENIVDYSSQSKNALENIGKASIKMPHFSLDWETQGNMAALFQKVGLQGVPKIKVDWYAEGGFPNAGDLFIANEAGAEWVGSMNGRTAVANNDQISKGVEEASYRGMARALQEYGYAGVTVINKLDSKEIASKTTKVIRSNANMYG